MKYYIICKKLWGDQFETELKANNDLEAYDEMCRSWDALTEYNQSYIEDYYLVKADTDEDGIIDLENADYISSMTNP